MCTKKLIIKIMREENVEIANVKQKNTYQKWGYENYIIFIE